MVSALFAELIDKSCRADRDRPFTRLELGRRRPTSVTSKHRNRGSLMTKVLVLYYSSYGHIEAMARAAAEGVREAGAEVDVKRVPELVPDEVARKSGFKLDQPAPVATVDDLASYDAIILGIPTRYGVMAAQMKNFWDQTGALWMTGALVGKVGSVFASTATQHGGQETTIISAQTMLLH